MIVVQVVRTSWTKQSRGGPGATLRAAAPVGFVVPRVSWPQAHEVLMHERDGFVAQEDVVDGPSAVPELELGESDGAVTVALRELGGTARPTRGWRPAAIRLAPGEWLRWQIDHRFSGRQEWWWRLDTVNVACGPVPTDVFVSRPTRRVDERMR